VSTTKSHDDIRLVVQTWLGTRLVIALVAAWTVVFEHRKLAEMFSAWDVEHYLAIAANGYANHDLVAFFPGWPGLIRLASSIPGTSPLVLAVVMTLLASGFAAAALYRLGGAPAAIAWLLAPAAVFTVVPYSEAVFCAAAFWAWERAVTKHWTAAAVLAAVATSFRVSGLFLIVALAVLALTQAGKPEVRLGRLARLTLPAAVLGGYLFYLRLTLGSWTAWYDTQAHGWAREFTWPWVSLQHTIDAALPGGYADSMGWSPMFRFELISMAAGILVALIMLFRKRWAESVWVGSQVAAFSFSYWFMSVNRATLLWFPLWEVVGGLGKAHRRRRLPVWRLVVNWLLVIAAVLLQAWWAWMFFTGQWSS
jgi:hypothetical protein